MHVSLIPAIKGWRTLQVLITHPDYEKQYTLTPSRNHAAMSLCRNSKVAFARHSLDHGALRMQLLKKIEKSVKAETKAVCIDPMFMGRSVGALKTVTLIPSMSPLRRRLRYSWGFCDHAFPQLVPKYTMCHLCV